ncbi:MAG: RNA helicase [Phylliscum demangeonii]|nr:MAG: RNA helicase [Phylliscum demangeonii]
MGKACDLLTGDEQKITEGGAAAMKSCTVEMIPLGIPVDVAVIDEVQMIGHQERGWAWTQALLGIEAKEVHLCGEERVIPLIKQLALLMGEKLIIRQYRRLSPLEVSAESLGGDITKIREGDCVVVFSRAGIHRMRRHIEKTTGKKCVVVYGSLPPAIRASQAKLFNEPGNGHDILVASDAVGMGLNLSIKRMVFTSTVRRLQSGLVPLTISDIKQIAGRAGRFQIAKTQEIAGQTPGERRSFIAPGLVTTLDNEDFPVIQHAMKSEAMPLRTAGLYPPPHVIAKFYETFPRGVKLSEVLRQLEELARLNPQFHICIRLTQIEIADFIEEVAGLSVLDRLQITASPARPRDEGVREIVKAFARCIAGQGSGKVLHLKILDLDVMDLAVNQSKWYLERLELLHQSIVLYLWLSYRYPGVFSTRGLAFHLKELIEEKIDLVLAGYQAPFTPTSRAGMLDPGDPMAHGEVRPSPWEVEQAPLLDVDNAPPPDIAEAGLYEIGSESV